MFAVVVGLSSALVSLLKHFIQIENILIHLFGDSSSGKSRFQCVGNRSGTNRTCVIKGADKCNQS